MPGNQSDWMPKVRRDQYKIFRLPDLTNNCSEPLNEKSMRWKKYVCMVTKLQILD